jgi:hypothetical protein
MDENHDAESKLSGWTIAFSLAIVILVMGALVLAFVISS